MSKPSLRQPRLFLGLALIVALCASGTALAATQHKIDTSHSAIIFKVKHFNVGYTYGMFRNFTGMFNLDEAKPNKSSVTLEIDAKSIYTASKKRDKHLQNPDFLNTKLYPKITFTSTKVRKSGRSWTVNGKLTLHGTTRDVKIKMAKTGAGKDPWGNQRVGFEGKLKVKRSQYGMTKMIGPASDQIELILAFEGIKQ